MNASTSLSWIECGALSICGAMALSAIAACATDAEPLSQEADEGTRIDCLVPGQIRQLDDKVTVPTQRQLIQTTRKECRIRGGEEQQQK